MNRYASVVLCGVLALSGCGSKKTFTPGPVNGLCDTVQDRCLKGTPAGTGDNSPPYEWTCLGRNGGVNDSCSVPTAAIAEGEFFAGQGDLVERIRSAGPLRGKLSISDPSSDPDEEGTHANGMKRIALSMGVPAENLVFSPNRDQISGGEILVDGHPTAFARFLHENHVRFIAQQNILYVAAAGNLGTNDNRYDLWHPDHPHWEEHPEAYENAFEAFATGKLILARFAGYTNHRVDRNTSVHCGTAKDFCYSVADHDGWGGSSSATTALSALSFYLFQLWDTPQEVVNVLNTCAEDVGEPGIDEKYGRGIVSVVCDTVRNREVKVVAGSVQFSGDSPVLNRMMGRQGIRTARSPIMSDGRVSPRFNPFFAVNGYTAETMTGHLGGQFSLGETTHVLLSGGASYLPLGVRSSVFGSDRTPFMEFGTEQTVLEGDSYGLSLLGTYGYSGRGNIFARVGHLGAQYRHRSPHGTFSLHAGYRQIQGTIGIPGYREAGAAPVPFTDENPEIRFLFTLGQ